MDEQTTPGTDNGGTPPTGDPTTGKRERGGPRNRRPIHFLLKVMDEKGNPVAGRLKVELVLATRDSESFFRTWTPRYGEAGLVQMDYTPNGDKPAAA